MSPQFTILLLAVILTLPFYFFNRFLMRKLRPRESGKNLLVYFATIVLSVFVYITACIFVVITVARLINKS